MKLEQLLAVTGPDEPSGWQTNLRWLRTMVLVHVAVRSFLTFGDVIAIADFWTPLRYAVIGTAAAGAVLSGLRPHIATWVTRVLLFLVGAEIWLTVPFTANHVFLEFLCLTLLALLDERKEGEDALMLQGFRWLVAIFFAATGLQKALYGYYFDGQFLAFVTGTEERFTAFFQYLMPADEVARLKSYNLVEMREGVFRPKTGSGPYRVDSAIFVLLSNFVWIAELLIGMLLLLKPTRTWATIAGIVFVVFIEAGAREFTFGVLMLNLFFLSLPGDWVKRCFWFFVAFYAYLILHKFDLVPFIWYSPA